MSRAAALVLVCCVAALTVGTAGAAAFAPSSTPVGDWLVVGGRINAVARAGDAVYIGGRFQGLARHAPGIGAFDPETGALVAPAGRLDPIGSIPVSVTAITDAPDGSIYVAGAFAGAGGVDQPRLLRFTAAGALDAAFRPKLGVGAVVDDMDLGANGVLYLAGSFSTVGDSPRSGGVAAVDAATGAVRAWQPAVAQGSVAQLEAGPNAVYLGGSFGQLAGDARYANAAAVTLDDGKPTAWLPAPDGPVRALAVVGSSVYLGGAFANLGGAAHSRLAAVDATTGAAKTSWAAPAPDGDVDRIVADASRVFVAGSFNVVGSTPRRRLAALKATTGELLPWDPQASREPSDLALSGERVYLSWRGQDLLPKLGAELRCGLASVSADTGAATAWNPSVDNGDQSGISCNPDNGVYQAGTVALSAAAGKVWAGGSFSVANVRPRSGLAALNALTGEPLAWAPALKGGGPFGTDIVHDLVPSADGSTIYIGGSFANVEEQSRKNAAAITSSGALTAWNPAPTGVVRTLALSPDGGRVYLGGDFTQLGASDRPRLAAVGSSTTGTTVIEAWRPNPSSAVLDLLTDAPGGRLYAGGRFVTIGGAARAGLAALDVGASATAPAVTSWNPALTTAPAAEVESLARRGTQVVAGGAFSSADGGRRNLAAFEVADAALAAWSPAVNGRVQTVAVDAADATTYVTGTFSTVGEDLPRSGAAAFAVNGAPTGWDPSPGNTSPASQSVAAIATGGVLPLGDRLLLTGAFINIGGQLQGGFAFFGPAQAPTPAGPPGVTGSPQVGERLTCVPGRWSGGRGTLSIAWLRDGAPIAGATSPTYTIVGSDGGHALSCRETMSNAAGAPAQTSSAVGVTRLAPALDTAPVVGGEAWIGGTARCTTGLWRNNPTNPYAFRWFLDDAEQPIAGAATADYGVSATELDHALSCEVTASNEAGSQTARSPKVTITEAPPVATIGPQIAGEPRVGTRLTCDPGPWERAPGFSYQWLRARVPLVEAVTSTYVATSRDLGKELTCLVTAVNRAGSTSAESLPVVVQASIHSSGTGRRANVADDASPSSATTAAARAIDIRAVTLRSGRKLAVTVLAPSGGSISVTVARTTVVKASAATKSKKAKKATTKSVTLAKGSRSVRRAGKATLQLPLSSTARALVARAGAVGLRVSVRVRFVPALSSKATSDRTTVSLRAPGAR